MSTNNRMALRGIVAGLDDQPLVPGLAPAPPLQNAPAAPMLSALPPVSLQQAPKGMSKGQLIAGILSDALAGFIGKPGAFAAQNAQRAQQQAEDVRWHRDRSAGLEDYEAKQRIEARYKTPDVPPMLRDAQTWAAMTPEQREAWKQMRQAGEGDPFLATTLPNQQFYAGPRSGLAAALGGNPAPVAAPVGPLRPVGKLRPVGGQTLPASGNFPDPLKAPGTITSGRRTIEGNRLVGGAENSNHLRGEAADYVGTSKQALQNYFGPKAVVEWHRNHWHTNLPGGNVPYYGKRGTTGLRGR